ncbi:MAG: intradiol ring-cleavage dioxygenase [Anaerolineae bacterium]
MLGGALGTALLAACAATPAPTTTSGAVGEATETPSTLGMSVGTATATVSASPTATAPATATVPPSATATTTVPPSPTASATGTPDSAEAATAAAITPPAASPTPLPTTTAGCVVRPSMTEGPYFVDEKLERSDVRSDPASGEVRQGVPLALTFAVSQASAGACTPLAGAQVDIWHCDAEGIYSDVNDRRWNTVGQQFLRGYQLTDAGGRATFTTIYPGWYSGRTVHIHFKIRSAASSGQQYDFTSQLFFDEATTAEVYTQEPYAARGPQDTTNSRDGIFRSGGEQLLLVPTRTDGGYAATFDIALDLA